MVEASSHCWVSMWLRVNQRGRRLGTTDTIWWGREKSPEGAVDSRTGNLSTEKTKQNFISSLLHIKTEEVICPPSRTFHEGKEIIKVQCFFYRINNFPAHLNSSGSLPQAMVTESTYKFKNNSSVAFPHDTHLSCYSCCDTPFFVIQVWDWIKIFMS